MRPTPIAIALIVAALHRLAVVFIFALGFRAAMTAFNGNSTSVRLSGPLMVLFQLLDFPVFVMNCFAFRFTHDYFPHGGIFAIFANELPFRFLLSLGWSLSIGLWSVGWWLGVGVANMAHQSPGIGDMSRIYWAVATRLARAPCREGPNGDLRRRGGRGRRGNLG